MQQRFDVKALKHINEKILRVETFAGEHVLVPIKESRIIERGPYSATIIVSNRWLEKNDSVRTTLLD